MADAKENDVNETEDIRSRLQRVRRPRSATYGTLPPGAEACQWDVPGSEETGRLPFVVGVMGDFLGATVPSMPVRDRNFIWIDRDNFDEVLQRLRPGLDLRVENTLADDNTEIPVELNFASIRDFEPFQVAQQVEPLRRLLDVRRKLDELLEKVGPSPLSPAAFGADEADQDQDAPPQGLLDQIIAATPQADDIGVDESRANELISALLNNADAIQFDPDTIRTIHSCIREIDRLMSRQLAAVMHSPEFQRLEGSWRGLHYLVMNSETGEWLQIRMLPCTKQELQQDLASLEQSAIFATVYDALFDPGGTPFAAILGDYEFANSDDDIVLLEKLSQVAATVLCPFISAPSPELFGFANWEELDQPRDLATVFDDVRYIKWRAFRETEASRFVALTLPRALARLPYGSQTQPVEEFAFEELPTHHRDVAVEHLCWMNSAYVLGGRMTEAFATVRLVYRYCRCRRRGQGRGSAHDHSSLGLRPQRVPSLKHASRSRLMYELHRLGIAALLTAWDAACAVYVSVPSVHQPKQYVQPEATAEARQASQLPFIMATCRCAHFLIKIATCHRGTTDPTGLAALLNNWISQFVRVEEKPAPELRARYPLREAKVEILPAKPDHDAALVVHLRPSMPLTDTTATARFKIPLL